MIFPRNKKSQAAPAAWWQSPAPAKSGKGTVALIAVLAGSVGGFLGVNAAGGDFFNRVQLVSSTSTIQRAPDSVAGIAQRVLPELSQSALVQLVVVALDQDLLLIATVTF